METNIQIFNNPRFGEVRVTEIDEKTYFVGKDVATILGYADTKKAVEQHVDAEDKLIVQLSDIQEGGVLPHMQGSKIGLISESGVYALIFGSTLPKAKEFKKWVTSEVLPSIRKHGGYLTPQKTEELLQNPDLIIQLANSLKEERQKVAELKHKEYELARQNELMKPKAELVDKILDCDQKIDIGQAAKILGLPFGRNTLFVKLREKGIFFKNRNEPKQEYIEKMYFELREKWIDREHHDGFMVVKVLVTQKGLDFLAKLFEVIPKKKKLAEIV